MSGQRFKTIQRVGLAIAIRHVVINRDMILCLLFDALVFVVVHTSI